MLQLLIVDDEPLERQAIRYVLQRERPAYQIVGEGRDGSEAVRLAKKFSPDVVLLDIKMPVMDGLEAGKVIRKIRPEARLVFVTAYDEFAYAQEAIALGASRYLLKPVAAEELITLLDDLAQEIEKERQAREETKQLRSALEEMLPLIRQGFALDLVAGHIEHEKLKAQAEFLGLTSLPRLVMVAAIDRFPERPGGLLEAERQYLKKRVWQILEETASEWRGALVVPGLKEEFLLLLPTDHLLDRTRVREGAISLGKKLCEKVRQLTPLTITVGIGRPVMEPVQLSRSYAEAAAAAEYRLLYGGDQVIHADDVTVLPRSREPFSSPAEQNLALAVRLGNKEAAWRYFTHIMAETVFRQEVQPPVLKVKILELISLATRSALEAGANPDEIAEVMLAGSTELVTGESLNELQARVKEKIGILVDKVVQAREQRNNNLIDRAIKFIKENYHRDISLEDVAHHVYLSPCYFSRLFKQVQGENFIDYLTRVRLEVAKELLLRTDLSINEIAARVGYKDYRYFGQVFKKMEGITPTIFRKKIGGG